ncbi:hypothetical protein [Daphnis nerii cypovirus]|uniref:hypothetical protein n=1 Tax=Daphnis nerii cypovirus TaxID=1986950 RepID=UPI000EB6ED14|nr:hypothetical protein [Daphnis nerii cypovirus]AYA29391.1 hypothetical protein [Daphnis nerii cypovirus]
MMLYAIDVLNKATKTIQQLRVFKVDGQSTDDIRALRTEFERLTGKKLLSRKYTSALTSKLFDESVTKNSNNKLTYHIQNKSMIGTHLLSLDTDKVIWTSAEDIKSKICESEVTLQSIKMIESDLTKALQMYDDTAPTKTVISADERSVSWKTDPKMIKVVIRDGKDESCFGLGTEKIPMRDSNFYANEYDLEQNMMASVNFLNVASSFDDSKSLKLKSDLAKVGTAYEQWCNDHPQISDQYQVRMIVRASTYEEPLIKDLLSNIASTCIFTCAIYNEDGTWSVTDSFNDTDTVLAPVEELSATANWSTPETVDGQAEQQVVASESIASATATTESNVDTAINEQAVEINDVDESTTEASQDATVIEKPLVEEEQRSVDTTHRIQSVEKTVNAVPTKPCEKDELSNEKKTLIRLIGSELDGDKPIVVNVASDYTLQDQIEDLINNKTANIRIWHNEILIGRRDTIHSLRAGNLSEFIIKFQTITIPESNVPTFNVKLNTGSNIGVEPFAVKNNTTRSSNDELFEWGFKTMVESLIKTHLSFLHSTNPTADRIIITYGKKYKADDFELEMVNGFRVMTHKKSKISAFKSETIENLLKMAGDDEAKRNMIYDVIDNIMSSCLSEAESPYTSFQQRHLNVIGLMRD